MPFKLARLGAFGSLVLVTVGCAADATQTEQQASDDPRPAEHVGQTAQPLFGFVDRLVGGIVDGALGPVGSVAQQLGSNVTSGLTSAAKAGVTVASTAYEYASRFADLSCVSSYSNTEWWKGVAAVEAASLAGIVTSLGQCEQIVSAADFAAMIGASSTIPLNACTCKAVFGSATAQGSGTQATPPAPPSWHAWVKLDKAFGGTLTGSPAAVRTQGGDHWVFVRGGDGYLWEIDSAGGVWGSLFRSPYTIASSPTAAIAPDNAYVKIASTNGTSLIGITWGWADGWRGPYYMGGSVTGRPSALQAGSNTELWANRTSTGSARALSMDTWYAGTGTPSHSGFVVKTYVSANDNGPTVVSLDTRRFALTTTASGLLQVAEGIVGGFMAPQQIGYDVDGPATAFLMKDGTTDYLDVYAKGTEGFLWRIIVKRTSGVNGPFSVHKDWHILSSMQIASAPVVVGNLQRRTLFVRGADGALYVKELK